MIAPHAPVVAHRAGARLRSFQGDASIREQVVARLQAADLPEFLSGGPLAYGADEVSPAGLIAHSSDAAVFPAALGLPRWLAFAIDEAFGGALCKPVAARLAEAIAGWPLGEDLSRLAGPVAARIIASAQAAVGSDDGALAELHAMAEQTRIWHQTAGGPRQEEGASDPWRSLRRGVMRATDAAGSPSGRWLGACVEAAAWGDLGVVDTTVAEVLRAWRILRFGQLDEALGWTEAVQARVEAAHLALEEELKSRSDASAELFQQLLKERYPEEVETLHRYYTERQAQAETLAVEAQDLLLSALADSGCAQTTEKDDDVEF